MDHLKAKKLGDEFASPIFRSGRTRTPASARLPLRLVQAPQSPGPGIVQLSIE
jgi:hypothetical protein